MKEHKSTAITLDAWAVLAWLQGEPAAAAVKNLLEWAEGNEKAKHALAGLLSGLDTPPQLFLNLVNLGEVYYILGRRQGASEAKEVIEAIKSGPVNLVEATEEVVMSAAAIKMKHALSYADAFAAATAQLKNASLLTGDPELKSLEEVSVLWIGDSGSR